MRLAALVLLALTLTGCETTAERSAKLERAAKQREAQASQRAAAAARALAITRRSTKVTVTSTALLRSREGTAAAVTLRNTSATPLRAVPIAITVRDAHGASLYTNRSAGEPPAMVAVADGPAHGETTWVDDQIQTSGTPASVTAEIGEAEAATGTIPQLAITGVHVTEEGGGPGAEGSVVNRSSVDQQELVVYAVARRAGRIVAAGRAILPQAPAGGSTRFQLFFIGSPAGAKLDVSAPPTTG